MALFGIKIFAGVITGSVAITADAFNNLSDLKFFRDYPGRF